MAVVPEDLIYLAIIEARGARRVIGPVVPILVADVEQRRAVRRLDAVLVTIAQDAVHADSVAIGKGVRRRFRKRENGVDRIDVRDRGLFGVPGAQGLEVHRLPGRKPGHLLHLQMAVVDDLSNGHAGELAVVVRIEKDLVEVGVVLTRPARQNAAGIVGPRGQLPQVVAGVVSALRAPDGGAGAGRRAGHVHETVMADGVARLIRVDQGLRQQQLVLGGVHSAHRDDLGLAVAAHVRARTREQPVPRADQVHAARGELHGHRAGPERPVKAAGRVHPVAVPVLD